MKGLIIQQAARNKPLQAQATNKVTLPKTNATVPSETCFKLISAHIAESQKNKNAQTKGF